MEITFSDAAKAYHDYNEADTLMSGYVLSFPDGVNEVDPLLMIKTMQGRGNLDTELVYTLALINGKKVCIDFISESRTDEDGSILPSKRVTVLNFVYNGQGQISHLFTSKPYLLQLLVDYSRAYLLKKLTPPSNVSME